MFVIPWRQSQKGKRDHSRFSVGVCNETRRLHLPSLCSVSSLKILFHRAGIGGSVVNLSLISREQNTSQGT